MSVAATPEVLWAQRSHPTDETKNYIFLTISVPDVPKSNLKLDLKPTSLTFTGHSDSLKRSYHLDLEFYAEVDVAESKINHTPKNVEIVLRKKELKEEFWPRLLKDTKKVHFLKTDFDKWVDEDEQEEAPEEDVAGMGGMGGMPGMGDMSSMMGGAGGDFGGIDFSKLGGAEGLGAGLGEGDDDDDDDEDIPGLEGEDEDAEASASASKSSSKIEEIN